MFDKFGEFDSADEMNRAAAAQRKEGDNEAILAIAEENGIDKEDAMDFIDGCVAAFVTPLRNHKKLACDIYYNQSDRGFEWNYPWDNRGCFDIKNPVNRRMNEEYLYPEGIEAALEGTCYEAWKRTFHQLAEAGKKLEYNRLMWAQSNKGLVNMVEYLFKGRFNRLLQETTRKVSCWTCEYYGPLYKDGETIEEVFNLSDRQIINRIRECDGGENAVRWMRWAEKTGKKIDQETLRWLTTENIEMANLSFVQAQMSPRQGDPKEHCTPGRNHKGDAAG